MIIVIVLADRAFVSYASLLTIGGNSKMRKILIIFMLVLVASFSMANFFRPDIRAGYGVTSTGWLSDYFEPLKGTNMDTPVY